MEGFVSQGRTGVAALAVSLSVVWLVFILNGSPWAGLAWVASLSFAAALWAARWGRAPAVAVTVPALTPAPKPVR